MKPEVARERFDALLALCGAIKRAHPTFLAPRPVAELMAELYAQGFAISEVGNATALPATLDHVSEGDWQAPGDAGAAVGLSDRRVRQLCAADKIRARRVGAGRWLVDVADLRRHLRGDAA